MSQEWGNGPFASFFGPRRCHFRLSWAKVCSRLWATLISAYIRIVSLCSVAHSGVPKGYNLPKLSLPAMWFHEFFHESFCVFWKLPFPAFERVPLSKLVKMFHPQVRSNNLSYSWIYFLARFWRHAQLWGGRRGGSGLHDPKMYRPFTFPCNFFSVFFQEALDRVCKSDLVGWFVFPDSFSNMTNNRLANWYALFWYWDPPLESM